MVIRSILLWVVVRRVTSIMGVVLRFNMLLVRAHIHTHHHCMMLVMVVVVVMLQLLRVLRMMAEGRGRHGAIVLHFRNTLVIRRQRGWGRCQGRCCGGRRCYRVTSRAGNTTMVRDGGRRGHQRLLLHDQTALCRRRRRSRERLG